VVCGGESREFNDCKNEEQSQVESDGSDPSPQCDTAFFFRPSHLSVHPCNHRVSMFSGRGS